MEKVNGIGGLFFGAKDPNGLAQWYFTHLVMRLSPRTTTNDDPKEVSRGQRPE